MQLDKVNTDIKKMKLTKIKQTNKITYTEEEVEKKLEQKIKEVHTPDMPGFPSPQTCRSMGSWWFLMKDSYDTFRVGIATRDSAQKPNNVRLSGQQKKLFKRLVSNPGPHPLSKTEAIEVCRQLLQRKKVPGILQKVASCFAEPSVVDVQMLRMCVERHGPESLCHAGFYVETLAMRHGMLLVDFIDVAKLDSTITLTSATRAAAAAETLVGRVIAPNRAWSEKQWARQRKGDMGRFVHRYVDLLNIAQIYGRSKLDTKTLKFLGTYRQQVVQAVNE